MDDKIIAVCADDPEYRHFTDISELPPHRLAEIRRFFEDCILHYDSNSVDLFFLFLVKQQKKLPFFVTQVLLVVHRNSTCMLLS